jgi:putative cell wall-binding protein
MHRSLLAIAVSLPLALTTAPASHTVSDPGAFAAQPVASSTATTTTDPVTSLRLEGRNRFATAAAVAAHFRERPEVVFVGSSDSPADVLLASARGAAIGAPVLLVRRNMVPKDTTEALSMLKPREVVVMGGEASVDDKVVRQLQSYAGEVRRISGPDRYAVSAAVAAEYSARGQRVYLTSGEAFSDALTAGSLAGSQGVPMLVTRKDRLDSRITEQLERLEPSEVVVVGGTAVVSDEVAAEAASYAAAKAPVRVAGADRYATAAAVAERYGIRSDDVYVASGVSTDDALVAAAVSGFHDSPLLLTEPTSVPDPISEALGDLGPTTLYVVGGPAAISDATVGELTAAARPPAPEPAPDPDPEPEPTPDPEPEPEPEPEPDPEPEPEPEPTPDPEPEPEPTPDPDPQDGYVDGWGYPTWQDEFGTDGTPDPESWNVRDRSTFGLLNDATIIRSSQTRVEDGKVVIRGEWMPESDWQYTSTGPQGNPTLRAMKTGYLEHRLSSGSDTIYSQRWGMWQYKVKMPMKPDSSLGTLGAVWLRNAKSGEIDLTEGWGSGPKAAAKEGWYPAQPKPNAGKTAFTVHSNTMGGGTKEAWTQPDPVYDEWVEYRFIYTPDEFSFYRKREGETEWVEQFHLTPTSWRMLPGTLAGPTPTTQDHFAKLWTDTAAYDSPWHIRMNLHIGPSTKYWGVPDPANPQWTDNPVMEVDYVRIYEHTT